MFYRRINENIHVSLSIPAYADKMYDLIVENRKYLRKWLPWANDVRGAADTKAFIHLQLKRFANGEALNESVFYKGELAGVLGYNQIDHVNSIGYIGYWLGEQYTGMGIMTLSITDLIAIGFTYLSLEKIDIRCARDNNKSRAIPERIGFKEEGVLRKAQKIQHSHYDLVIYGLLKEEFLKKSTPHP